MGPGIGSAGSAVGRVIPSPLLRVNGRVEPAGLQFTHSRKFRLQITALDYLVGEPSHTSGPLSKAGVNEVFCWFSFSQRERFFFRCILGMFFFPFPDKILKVESPFSGSYRIPWNFPFFTLRIPHFGSGTCWSWIPNWIYTMILIVPVEMSADTNDPSTG